MNNRKIIDRYKLSRLFVDVFSFAFFFLSCLLACLLALFIENTNHGFSFSFLFFLSTSRPIHGFSGRKKRWEEMESVFIDFQLMKVLRERKGFFVYICVLK